CAFVDPQCCALLRVGVGAVHNGILQDSVRIPVCPLSDDTAAWKVSFRSWFRANCIKRERS
ncbi:hypothetical protein, partial [Corynebacterium diphtheriae]|uniref:hypothetical protein n=1 Tax=Corynebacterium diphtheriae TaxID=1717 RepID=UPI0019D38336